MSDTNSLDSKTGETKTGSTRSFFGSQTSKWLLAGAIIASIGAGVAWSRGGHGNGGWHGQGAGGHRMGAGQQMCERDPLKFEGVARAFLKADLDLKSEQNAELDKLAATLLPALKDLRDEMCNNFAAKAGGPAPDRLERLAVLLRKAADTAERSVPPARSFYATLDEKQKARVDELADRRNRFGRGMHGPGRSDDGPRR